MATESRQEKYYLSLTEDPQITGASHARPPQPCRASRDLSLPSRPRDARAQTPLGSAWEPAHPLRGVKRWGQGLPRSLAAALSPGASAAGLQSLIKLGG